MEAKNLLPDFFYLLVDTSEEPDQEGRIASFTTSGACPSCPRCKGEVNHSAGGASCTLLLVLLTFAEYRWPVATHPFTVNRYETRPGTFRRANNLRPEPAETLTLAEIFGGTANAQAVVDEAWQRIHLDTEEAVLTRPE